MLASSSVQNNFEICASTEYSLSLRSHFGRVFQVVIRLARAPSYCDRTPNMKLFRMSKTDDPDIRTPFFLFVSKAEPVADRGKAAVLDGN